MNWREHNIGWSSLIYQYTDIAGSPDEVTEWATSDLEYLRDMLLEELQRRAHSAGAPTE